MSPKKIQKDHHLKQCPFCKKHFKTSTFYYHLNNEHAEVQDEYYNANKECKCTYCHKYYKSADSLRKHVKICAARARSSKQQQPLRTLVVKSNKSKLIKKPTQQQNKIKDANKKSGRSKRKIRRHEDDEHDEEEEKIQDLSNEILALPKALSSNQLDSQMQLRSKRVVSQQASVNKLRSIQKPQMLMLPPKNNFKFSVMNGELPSQKLRFDSDDEYLQDFHRLCDADIEMENEDNPIDKKVHKEMIKASAPVYKADQKTSIQVGKIPTQQNINIGQVNGIEDESEAMNDNEPQQMLNVDINVCSIDVVPDLQKFKDDIDIRIQLDLQLKGYKIVKNIQGCEQQIQTEPSIRSPSLQSPKHQRTCFDSLQQSRKHRFETDSSFTRQQNDHITVSSNESMRNQSLSGHFESNYSIPQMDYASKRLDEIEKHTTLKDLKDMFQPMFKEIESTSNLEAHNIHVLSKKEKSNQKSPDHRTRQSHKSIINSEIKNRKVSTGYAEITERGLTKVIDVMQKARSRDSLYAYLDVGSGFGAAVLQFAIYTGVHCHGIEISQKRLQHSVDILDKFKRSFREKNFSAAIKVLGHIMLFNKDIADMKTLDYVESEQRQLHYTHIYAFDKVFSEQSRMSLVDAINNSCWVQVLAWTNNAKVTFNKYKLDSEDFELFETIPKVATKSANQQFQFYVYKRKDKFKDRMIDNNSTAPQNISYELDIEREDHQRSMSLYDDLVRGQQLKMGNREVDQDMQDDQRQASPAASRKNSKEDWKTSNDDRMNSNDDWKNSKGQEQSQANVNVSFGPTEEQRVASQTLQQQSKTETESESYTQPDINQQQQSEHH